MMSHPYFSQPLTRNTLDAMILCAVLTLADTPLPLELVQPWTPEQRAHAAEWARRKRAKHQAPKPLHVVEAEQRLACELAGGWLQ